MPDARHGERDEGESASASPVKIVVLPLPDFMGSKSALFQTLIAASSVETAAFSVLF